MVHVRRLLVGYIILVLALATLALAIQVVFTAPEVVMWVALTLLVAVFSYGIGSLAVGD